MIEWPSHDEVGYDSNGFRKKLTEIVIQNIHDKLTAKDQQKIAIWKTTLLPTLEEPEANKTQKFLQLCKQHIRNGVPDKLRYYVWPRLINTNLVCGVNSISILSFPPYSTLLGQRHLYKLSKVIELDLSRTFPDNIFFDKNNICYRSLHDLLNCLSVAFPKMGYCQGLNFIAASLLIKVKEEEAYHILCYILDRLEHRKLLEDLDLVRRHLYVMDKLIESNYKQLYRHMRDYGIESLQYASSWFITLFTNCLPFNILQRVLECYFFEGHKVLYRVALAILKYKKKHLKELKEFDSMLLYLKDFRHFRKDLVDEDEFLKTMFSFSISRKAIEQHFHEYKPE